MINSKKYLSIVLSVIFTLLFALYVGEHQNDFKQLLDFKPIYIIGALFGHLGVIFTNGLIVKWIMEPFGKFISVRESFYVSLISSAGNFFLPVGTGTGFRALYLKQKHKLNYKNFFSTLYGNYIIVIFVNSVAAILSLVFLQVVATEIGKQLIIVFTLLIGITISASILKLPKKIIAFMHDKFGRIGRILTEILDGWLFIAAHKRLLWRLITAAIMNFLAALLISFSALKAVGVSVSLWVLILYSSLSVLTLLVNITPGSLGIKEGLYIYSSSILNLNTPQILSSAIVDRLTKFIILLLGWLVLKTTGRLDRYREITNSPK